jgi:hypothetical protein
MGVVYTKKKILGDTVDHNYQAMKENYSDLQKSAMNTAESNHEVLKAAKARLKALLDN